MSEKSIETLVPDIYELFTGDTFRPKPEEVVEFGVRLSNHIASRVGERRGGGYLRLSNLGTPCDRKLWYSINTPSDAEALRPEVKIKFLFGDILEELLLFLAQQAGHRVEGQQDELEINGVKGHRDAIIDGRTIDVKSASTYSYKKFESNDLPGNDSFGYLSQLGAYLNASKDDPRVVDKDRASFLVIDKTLGKVCLDTYQFPEYDYYKVVEQKRAMLDNPEPPEREYDDVPEGKSGNRKLGVACSYCPFKAKCWPRMRTFAYASGPVFLTAVVKQPLVPEIKDYESLED